MTNPIRNIRFSRSFSGTGDSGAHFSDCPNLTVVSARREEKVERIIGILRVLVGFPPFPLVLARIASSSIIFKYFKPNPQTLIPLSFRLITRLNPDGWRGWRRWPDRHRRAHLVTRRASRSDHLCRLLRLGNSPRRTICPCLACVGSAP